jgi:uncharacterized protein DUF6152
MKTKLMVAFTLGVGIFLVSTLAFAHHSSAPFDVNHLITLQGTVTNFEWSNPHGFIHLEVTGEKGGVAHWLVETNSPNMLTRAGWKKDMIKPGDIIHVTGARARNGTKVMRLNSVTLASGEQFDGQGFK